MQIACPACQKQLRVPDTAAGKTVKCPACSKTFQAFEIVEEQIQSAPPKKSPKAAPPPVQVDEEEEVPPPRKRRGPAEDDDERPRRRRDRDDEPEEEDDDDRLRRRRDRDDDDDDRPRSRRPRDDEEEEEVDYKADKKEARRRGSAAALWFIFAGVISLVFITLSLGSNLYITSQFGGLGNNVPRLVFLFGCGLLFVLGGVYHFLAASALKSLKGKGTVITSIVFGFIFGALAAIGVIINLVLVSQVPGGFLSVLVFIAIIFGAATSFFNLFAAIKGCVTLSNRAVRRQFNARLMKRAPTAQIPMDSARTKN